MTDGYIRAQPPKPAMALSKTSVAIFIGVLSLLVAFAINFGISQKGPARPENNEGRAYMDSSIMQLPSTYADLKPPKVLESKAVVLPTRKEQSEFERYREQLLKERLKRATEARLAPVVFKNFPEAAVDEGGAGDVSGEPTEASLGTPLNARDEANRQDEKRAFLETKGSSDEILGSLRRRPHSEFALMAGTIIPGVLLSGLNSDLPGQILGQVSQNVFDTATGRYLLVPQGTKVIGRYDSRISYGQERLLIVWNRLVFPDATSISLDTMPGVDLTGQAGLFDQVNNHYVRLFTGVVLSSLLGAGAQVANGPTYQSIDPAYGQLALQGFAKNANEVGQEITRRNLNVQPTLEIRPGFRFNIFVNRDMALEPHS